MKEIDALDGLMANKVIDKSGWLLVKERSVLSLIHISEPTRH